MCKKYDNGAGEKMGLKDSAYFKSGGSPEPGEFPLLKGWLASLYVALRCFASQTTKQK